MTPDNSDPAQSTGTREIYFTGSRKAQAANVWNRTELREGDRFTGPAVIEGEGSSALIPPGWEAVVDGFLNLDIRRT